MISDCICQCVNDVTRYLNDEHYADWYRPTDPWLNALLPAMIETVAALDTPPPQQDLRISTLIDLFHPDIQEIAANRDAVTAYFSFRLHRDAQQKVLEYYQSGDLDGMNQYIAEKRQALGLIETFSYFSSQG